MKIILYDIDGTLLSMSGIGFEALRRAWLEVHGVDIEKSGIIPDGRTDSGMFTEIADFFSIKERDFTTVTEKYVSILSESLRADEGKAKLLPGADRILKVLAGAEGIVQGLLTGNIYEGARVKLEHFGLFDYFMFGAFGDTHDDRNSLAMFALMRLRHLYGKGVSGKDLIIVGDTPWDVRCGKSIGAVTVGVTTGKYGRDDLEPEEPDVILDDLADCAGFVDFVSSAGNGRK